MNKQWVYSHIRNLYCFITEFLTINGQKYTKIFQNTYFHEAINVVYEAKPIILTFSVSKEIRKKIIQSVFNTEHLRYRTSLPVYLFVTDTILLFIQKGISWRIKYIICAQWKPAGIRVGQDVSRTRSLLFLLLQNGFTFIFYCCITRSLYFYCYRPCSFYFYCYRTCSFYFTVTEHVLFFTVAEHVPFIFYCYRTCSLYFYCYRTCSLNFYCYRTCSLYFYRYRTCSLYF